MIMLMGQCQRPWPQMQRHASGGDDESTDPPQSRWRCPAHASERTGHGTSRPAHEICRYAAGAALREHDPLDPWLTESGWDGDYWQAEAQQISDNVRRGMSESEVRVVIVEVLGGLLGS